jgi:hypothetical protein
MKLSLVDPHSVMFVQIDKPRIKGAVIRRGQGDTVPDMVNTIRRAYWKNMGSINQSKLDAGDSTTVAASEQDTLSESGFSTPPTHFCHNALTLLTERFHLLRLH